MEGENNKKGILAWFAQNHVAANLLMMFIVIGGLITVVGIKMEVFPEMSLDIITVTVPYLGATPSDVEEGVCVRVEEAITGISGIKKMTSTATEGFGTTVIEVEEYSDVKEVLDDIKAGVDRIITFPRETEKPVISELKMIHKVLSIVLYGDVSEKLLKKLADEIRDDLTAKENISQIQISGVRPYEISIEVSEETLRKYGLSFEQVAMAVGRSSIDTPAGSVKTSGGTILLRTKGQKYTGEEFEDIVVLTHSDGTEVKVGDIAAVRDDFEDEELFARFNGERAAQINVFRIGEQSALDVANTVKEYIRYKEPLLPEGVKLALWSDYSAILRSRINLLTRNAYLGLTMVFLCLLLFLNLRLAFWTAIGIPISFLGAFLLMPVFDISINMMSLFALIMVLGIVVDDAIVVGENIFTYRKRGLSRSESAIKGVQEMVMPVILAVLTTIFAFLPLAYTAGIMGKILRVLPIIVICVLSFSLVEALLILPAHLSGKKRINLGLLTKLADKLNNRTERWLEKFVKGKFTRWVETVVSWRYLTLSVGIFIFLVIIGFIAGGYIKFVFFDSVEADNIVATLVMPQGTPFEETERIANLIEKKAFEVIEEYDGRGKNKKSIMKHIITTVGANPAASESGGPGHASMAISGQSNLAEVNIELLSGEERNISTNIIKNAWRDSVGEIPGISSLTFASELMSAGEAINVELSHHNFDELLTASEELKDNLRDYSGVSDIADSFEEGKAEMKLSLKRAGQTLDLRLSDLATQVRHAFYGYEVQRIQRGRDDIRVMVRYPESERKSISDIDNMRVRLQDGTEIPFNTVAQVDYGRGYANIRRVDRRRVVNVTADVDEDIANTGEINNELETTVLPRLMIKYPGLQFSFSGEMREINESLGSLKTGFVIALMLIYAILAVQFRSYLQPLIIMSAIPFGIVGAVIGHLLLGYNLSILSMFGIVALSGVVVNDSLIMIVLINKERQSGMELHDVIRDSATRRFRPIMLTTLTTFFGLLPMMLEKSLQARFLIPMAISLAFGVIFATLITLFLVPSLYMILEDAKSKMSKYINV